MFPIGTSNSIIGIYKIIAALHQLMAWAEEEYRPWFESNMVPLTPEEKVAFGLAATPSETASEEAKEGPEATREVTAENIP